MKRKNSFQIFQKSIFILLFTTLIYSCVDAPVIIPDAEDLVISQYVDSFETYSEFNYMLERTRYNSLLAVRGPFTLFLPTNEAVDKFLSKNGYSSIDDIEEEALMDIVENHIVRIKVSSSDIGEGAISKVNLLGDKLSTRFDNSDILINNIAKISDRDIELQNGVIHEVDAIIAPLSKGVYQTIKDNPDYSIFAKGLEVTGIKDTLEIIDFMYGNKPARTYFTLLAVPDTIFNRYGMNNIDEAINYFTASAENIKSIDNEFYQFMEYHCLDGAYYLNEFGKSSNYPILSFNNHVAIEASDDYKFNYNKKTDTTYTSVFIPFSNVATKNGPIHMLTDLLPITLPEPAKIDFETTDHFDLKQGDYYGKYYKKWSDGQNTFANIKWEGDYMQYYYKPGAGGNVNNDCLNMIGHFWCEVTTPKIMKGSYDLSLYIWNGWLDYEVWVDGEKLTTVSRSDAASETLGTFKWDATEEHKIKIVSLTFGIMFWDSIIFTPVVE